MSVIKNSQTAIAEELEEPSTIAILIAVGVTLFALLTYWLNVAGAGEWNSIVGLLGFLAVFCIGVQPRLIATGLQVGTAVAVLFLVNPGTALSQTARTYVRGMAVLMLIIGIEALVTSLVQFGPEPPVTDGFSFFLVWLFVLTCIAFSSAFQLGSKGFAVKAVTLVLIGAAALIFWGYIGPENRQDVEATAASAGERIETVADRFLGASPAMAATTPPAAAGETPLRGEGAYDPQTCTADFNGDGTMEQVVYHNYRPGAVLILRADQPMLVKGPPGMEIELSPVIRDSREFNFYEKAGGFSPVCGETRRWDPTNLFAETGRTYAAFIISNGLSNQQIREIRADAQTWLD